MSAPDPARQQAIKRAYDANRGRMFTHEQRTFAVGGMVFEYQAGGDHTRKDHWFRVVCEGMMLKQSASAPILTA